MDEMKLGPMRTVEVVARMRQAVINARLRQLQRSIRSCLTQEGVPDTSRIDDEVYMLRHIVALDPILDTADILQTYLEFYKVYDILEEKGASEVYSIIFNLIHHISFTYAEHPYKVIPLDVRD